MIEELFKSARVSSNGRKYFTSDHKATIVNVWEQSGLSAPEFCRRYGMVVNVFYRWRKTAIRGAAMSIKHDGELYTRTERAIPQVKNIGVIRQRRYQRFLRWYATAVSGHDPKPCAAG